MRVRVPGDKSLTQRALILGALADGESCLSGLLYGGDAESTAGALRMLGVDVPDLPEDGSPVRFRGAGLDGLCEPGGPLDLGNSATGARLLLGVLAGAGLTATLTGDRSLRARPMARVTDPLACMGARIEFLEIEGRLPLRTHGGARLTALDWPTPVASAQVKSALMLAGITSGAFVMVTEPHRSRDHTERLLALAGAPVVSHAVEGGWRVELRDPPGSLRPLRVSIPGDFSSASFFLTLAALGGAEGRVTVEGVGLNPTRTGFLDVLERAGAAVLREPASEATPGAGDDAGVEVEPVGDVTVVADDARAVTIEPHEVARLVDEIPLVAILGARASGVTRIRGVQELRHKESDRISALADNLRGLGVRVDEGPEGLDVHGTAQPLRGRVRTRGDHRIAMAFGVLASLSGCVIDVDEPGCVEVSFPGFWESLSEISGTVVRSGGGP